MEMSVKPWKPTACHFFSISLRAVIVTVFPGVADLQFANGKHYKQAPASMTSDPRRGGFHM